MLAHPGCTRIFVNGSADCCAGVTSWANQLDHCRSHGTLIPVQRAIHIRGALGFIIRPSGVNHVVMFAGDGRTTMEAANHRVGCGHFSVTSGGRLRFTQAALIPGVYYPEVSGVPPASPAPNPLAELARQIEHARTTIVGFAPNEIHAGPEVTTMQMLLNAKYGTQLQPPLELTGVLDARTQLVLINFKTRWGRSNPGVASCAADTWEVLAS